jgi:hypothetical protein
MWRNNHSFLEVCMLSLSVYHKYSASNLRGQWKWDYFVHNYKKEYEFGITSNPQTLQKYLHIPVTVVATYVWRRGRKKFEHRQRLDMFRKRKTEELGAVILHSQYPCSFFPWPKSEPSLNYRQSNFAALFIWIVQLWTNVYRAVIRESNFLSSHNFLLLCTLFLYLKIW